MGYVYIFVNASFGDDWVKIGKADDVDVRLRQLNSSETTPFAFFPYATYEVENPLAVESEIHGLFDDINYGLRSRETVNGRIRTREFFNISAHRAFDIFKHIAVLRGDSDKLKKYQPNDEQIAEENRTVTARRKNFTFEMARVPLGAELTFIYDESCKCEVVENNKVKYGIESPMSLSALADKLLYEKCGNQLGSKHGPKYFTYDGVLLTDLREAFEDDHQSVEDL